MEKKRWLIAVGDVFFEALIFQSSCNSYVTFLCFLQDFLWFKYFVLDLATDMS